MSSQQTKMLYWKDALHQAGIDYAEVEAQLAFHGWEIRPIAESALSDTAQQETGDDPRTHVNRRAIDMD